MWSSIRPPKIPESCQSCHVRQRTLCGALQDDELPAVKKFKKGDRVLPATTHVYCPGEPCGEMFNLLDGWVALYRLLPSGRRQILDFALPGQFIGYQPDADAPMAHGAQCLTDVSLCVFPRRGFPELLRRHPEMGMALNAVAARDIGRAYDHITNVGARSALERIANLLLELSMRVGKRNPGSSGHAIDIPLAQHDIADALGLTSVYVSQMLKSLREKKVLVFRNGQLQIQDYVALARLADFDGGPLS